MKYLKVLTGFFALSLMLSACDGDFLQRTPLDAVTEVSYFSHPNDLRTYVNRFYSNSYFPRYGNHGSDFDSDNQVTTTPNSRLRGTRTINTTGSIGFANVRSINYFFDNYEKVAENHALEEYQQYLGEAHFFRALIYFNLLKSYGDIQWIDTELGTTSEELYNPRDPRDLVADNIIASLDSAAVYLTEDRTSGAGRVNKWMALLMQSRIALYEGSWQKYHDGTPFGVENADPEKYFRKAAEAAQQVMDSGLYQVYSTGDPETDYKELFSLQDYSSNDEVMFWRKYDNELTRGQQAFTNDRNFRMETPTGKTITKQLADAYLAIDGAPISLSPLFEGHGSLEDEMQNRDPRFYQTIATPDQVWRIHEDGEVEYWSEVYDNLNTSSDLNAPTGYVIQKGYNPDMRFHTQQYEETPSILYRYGEVLLNYAEAMAELGELSQDDLDNTVNQLRERVGMPPLVVGGFDVDPDSPFQDLDPLLQEIRRERRVELALEGFRWDDIARWAAADELIVGDRPKGFHASQLDENPYTVDEDGFLDPFQTIMPDGWGFELGRDYLNSIPLTEIALNPDNLEQNPGWQ